MKGLIAAIASMVLACTTPAPAALTPAPQLDPPAWCVEALLGTGELVQLCSDTRRTCRRGLAVARLWGPRWADVAALGRCVMRGSP